MKFKEQVPTQIEEAEDMSEPRRVSVLFPVQTREIFRAEDEHFIDFRMPKAHVSFCRVGSEFRAVGSDQTLTIDECRCDIVGLFKQEDDLIVRLKISGIAAERLIGIEVSYECDARTPRT